MNLHQDDSADQMQEKEHRTLFGGTEVLTQPHLSNTAAFLDRSGLQNETNPPVVGKRNSWKSILTVGRKVTTAPRSDQAFR